MRLDRPLSALSIPAGLALGLGVWIWAPFDGPAIAMLAITVFCISLWVGTPVPSAYTGLLCLALVAVLVSPDLALGAFDSPAVWLVVFGLLMGEAVRQSGLAASASRWILSFAQPPGGPGATPPVVAYRRLLFVTSAFALGLTLLVPSALVRVLMLAPIAREVGRTLDSDRARLGLLLGPLLVTYYSATGIFTAGIANIIVSGIGESVGDVVVSWTEWTLWMFPLMGLGRGLVVVAVTYYIFKPTGSESISWSLDVSGSRGTERRMVLFLAVGVAFWLTEFVHGFHPVFGALLVILLALTPKVGIVTFPEVNDVDFSIVYFLAAILVIGDGLTQTGISESVVGALVGYLPQDGSLLEILGLTSITSFLLSFLMGGLAAISVVTPMWLSIADVAGIPPEPVLMLISVGAETPLFPYQSAVIVAILGQKEVTFRSLVTTTGLVTAINFLLLVPLQIVLFAVAY